MTGVEGDSFPILKREAPPNGEKRIPPELTSKRERTDRMVGVRGKRNFSSLPWGRKDPSPTRFRGRKMRRLPGGRREKKKKEKV